MSLRAWYSIRIKALLEEPAGALIRIGLVFRMGVWWAGLRLLHPFLHMKWLVWLAAPGEIRPSILAPAVDESLAWLEQTFARQGMGECWPRALVRWRYLSLAGLRPSLLIGFDGQRGHAWVEQDGEAYREPEAEIRVYPPTLKLRPGERNLVKAFDDCQPGSVHENRS